MKGNHMKKRALISVSNKNGIKELATELLAQDYEIISTGGTYELIKAPGVLNISEVTGFPESMDGRVKTLHPSIHGGLLAVRDDTSHMDTIKELSIGLIDIVVVNLYPFKETLIKYGQSDTEIIENIDIGGPAMLRSAAKNHAYITVVVDPQDYSSVLEELRAGYITSKTRKDLAAKAFRHTAAYDALIASSFTQESFPEKLTLTYELINRLRYGENPHQQAAVYSLPIPPLSSIVTAQQLHGRELSYNNFADVDAALEIVKEFSEPAAVVIKHKNPCGVGIGSSIHEAMKNAYNADPVSIHGGIVALNKEVDEDTARILHEIFLDIIIAPSYSKDAQNLLTRKKNIRIMVSEINAMDSSKQSIITHISGGILIQESDCKGFDKQSLTFPTKRKPTSEELLLAGFAWTIVKYIKSNGILIAKGNMTVGIGPGQTNRVSAARIAIEAAGERAKGAVMASDGFFPFPDTVEEAAKAGIEVIIQPGGSINDSLSIEVCNKYGLSMIFTGVRHFRH